MMLTKSPSNGIPQNAPKRKLEDKSKDIKNAKQRRFEKVMQHVRQSPRRSTKDSKSDPGDYLEPLTCGVCAVTFSSKSRAKFCVHMKREHFLEVHYQCQACLKTFPDQRLLQHHKCQVLTAADDKQSKVQHTCTLCRLVFSSLYDINLHRWSSHGAKAYRCLQCSRLLGSVANLADHVHDHSRRPRVASNHRPFSPRHRRQKLLFNKQKKKATKKNFESAKTFQCDFCNHSFPNLSLTMEHRRGLHKEAKLTCNCCQQTFPDSTHLGQHLARASEDQVSLDTEMTDTAASGSNKEEADMGKESPTVEFPSSDTDVAPASSPATESSATLDMCDYTTTDQDPRTPCKKTQKVESPKEVLEAPSPVKPKIDTLPLLSKSPSCHVQNQCSVCKSMFTPKSTESKQGICPKCVVISNTNTLQENKNEMPPPTPVVETLPEKPKQEVTKKEPDSHSAKEDLLSVPAAEGPWDRKSDEEEDMSEDASAESKDPKKNYVCDFCEQSFGSVTWVMRHRKKHEEAQLKCNNCQIKFLQSSDLGHHLAECRQETSSPFCSTASSSNNACTSTVPLPVEKTNGKSFVCDFCSQSFASVSWVMRHRKQHVDDLGNYWCRVCFETFDKSADFGRHLADCVGVRKTPVQSSRVVADRKETIVKATAEKGKEAEQENGNSVLKRRFRCDFCSQRFASIRWVIRHRQQHTDDCTCQICFLTFDRTVELGRHLAAGCALVDDESETGAVKSDSDAKASKPDGPEKESSHEDMQPEACRSFESKDESVVFPCDFCLQSFASGRWVIRHRKQHEGGENLTCQRCQAKFNRSVELSKHLSVCPKTQDISVAMSQSSVTTAEGAEEDGNGRSFQCDICGQNYASARWVMRHRRSHNSSEFPYVCRNCKCSFNRSVEISQHLRLCHNSPTLLNTADQITRTGLGTSTENPNKHNDTNPISDQSVQDNNSENSFLNKVDLNASDTQPVKLNNDHSLPACVKVENFAAVSTPINLSLHPDSADKTKKSPKESLKEPSALDCSKKLDSLGKTSSPVDLVQRKKISSMIKKENENKLADPTSDKTQYLNRTNMENKSLPHKIPEGQFQVWQEPNVRPTGTGTKFSCDYCPSKFPDVITLLSHRRKHSLSTSCHRCGKKYEKCIEVCQHLERCCYASSQASSSTSPMVPKQYYCDFCFKTYGGSNWIMRHRRKHTDEKDYTCRVCKFSTKGAGFMARHLASCRWIKANLINSGFQPKKNISSPFVFPSSSAVSCDFCSASFVSIQELIQHRKYHTPEELTKCQHCDTTLISPKQMANHLACCSANPNNKKFLTTNPNRNGIIKPRDLKMKYQFKEQRARVDSEKVFTCDFCGQGFASCSMVMQHRRFHTKELAHVCRNCGNLFAISEMGMHLSICKKRSNSNQVLPSTDSRPLLDGEAGVLDLKKKYTCDFCSKTFDTSNWILQHRLIHTSNVPYKCYRCGQIFDLARSMADHLTTCHLSSAGQVSKLHVPISDKMTYLCDRCGGHFPRTEVKRATEAVTYRCHYCLKQNPVNSIMDQKMDGTCAHCVAGFDSPASLQDHLKNCTANKNRNEFYGNQKTMSSRLDEPGRRLSSAPPAHSKIVEPCYLEPQDLSINSFRTFTPSSANRFSATSPRKSFTPEDHHQNSLGGSSLIETPKMYQEKIYITQGSFERTSRHEQMTCTVPLTDFDNHNSVWDGNRRQLENQSVSGMPTDLRVEANGLKEPEKQKLSSKEKDIKEQKTEINGKDYNKTELIPSDHPSSNNSSKNAKERFTQSLNLISKNSKFPCDFCEAAFATDSSLLSHRLTHVDESSLWCRLCHRAFTNSSDFVCHLTCCKIQHKNTNSLWQSPSPNKKEPYRCDFCDKSFAHRHAVMRHRQEHEQEEGIFRCRRCDCVFYTSSVFVGHLSICMSRISSMPPNRSRATYWSSYGKNGYIGSWRRLVSTNREKTQKLYYCDFCRRRFGGSNWIMRHRRTHIDGCNYTCQLCGLVFKQAGLMADHLSQCYSQSPGRETPNRVKSSESESAASSPKTEEFTDRDSQKETDGKKQLVLSPYQCKHCSFLFDTKEDLESHVSSCNKCQDFKPLSIMNDQQQNPEAKISFEMPVLPLPTPDPMSPSSNQTEFPCDFCGKCFLGASWILRHRQTHVADPSDLKCQHCGQVFDNPPSFVSHLNSCLKPADCLAIQKAFLSKSSSSVHKQEVESGSASSEIEDSTPVSFTFECCSQTFSQVADLTAHIKTHSRRPST